MAGKRVDIHIRVLSNIVSNEIDPQQNSRRTCPLGAAPTKVPISARPALSAQILDYNLRRGRKYGGRYILSYLISLSAQLGLLRLCRREGLVDKSQLILLNPPYVLWEFASS